MRKLYLLSLLLAAPLGADTTVYLRTSAPRGVAVASVAHGTPPVVTTRTPHGLNPGDIVGIWGVCTGPQFSPSSGRSAVNIFHKVASSPAPTSLTFALNDLAGSPIALSEDSNNCSPTFAEVGSAAYAGKMTQVTLPDGPWGWFDGPTGPMVRRLALGVNNGLTSLVVSGGTATVTTNYSHGVSTGDRVSVTGSGNTALDTGNGAGAYHPYVVLSTDATHFTFGVGGVTNGTYSNVNNNCGPTATPNDLIGGTTDCLRISQVAYTGNPFWDGVVAVSNAVAGSDYRFVYDGGGTIQTPGSNTYPSQYGEAAMRFMVDQQNATMLAIPVYMANHVEMNSGVNWLCFAEGASCGFNIFDGNGDNFFDGISLVAAVAMPYMSSAHRQTFLDKIYNDVDNPTISSATTKNVDFSNFQNNKISNTGHAVAGSTGTITLAASASASDNFYNGQIVYTYYASNIVSITTGTITSITTDADWGLTDALVPAPGVATLYISGVTGGGVCDSINGRWLFQYIQQRANDKHNFSIPLDTTLCSSATGGATVTRQVGGSPVDGYVPMFGRIRSYNGTTKVATFDDFFQDYTGNHVAISTDMAYMVMESISVDDGRLSTSTTTLSISSFSTVSFFTQPGLTWQVTPPGYQHLRALSTGTLSYMDGNVIGFTGSSITVQMFAASGSTTGTHTDWLLELPPTVSPYGNTNGIKVTGYGTHFTTDMSTGDAVMSGNAWYGFGGYAANAECYIRTITDDTHLVCTSNQPSVQTANDTMGSASRTLWIAHKWAIGDAGVNWVQKHWIAQPGAQPLLYTAQGGDAVGWNYNGVREPAVGSNNGILNSFAHMAMGITGAQYGDARALEDAARLETYGFDYELSHFMTGLTGPGHSGAYYSFGVIYGIGFLAEEMAAIPGFPTIDFQWLKNTGTWKQYALYPDLNSYGGGFDPGFHPGTQMGYASETGNGGTLTTGNPSQGQLFDPIFSIDPTSSQAQYLRTWLSTSTSLDMWSAASASSNYLEPRALIHNPNNVKQGDYKSQPLQFAFLKGSQAAGSALTGWRVDPTISGNSVLSRMSWTDRSSDLLYFGVRTYSGDHDMPQNGEIWLYKVGGLLNGDAAPGLFIGGKFDFTSHGSMPRFGNDAHLSPSPEVLDANGNPSFGRSPMYQWYSDNHGTFDTQYGDKDSKLVWACANLIPAYAGIVIDKSNRCFAEFKDLSVNGGTGEHIFAQWDSIVTVSSPTSIETHVHYVQNGQPDDGTIACCMSYPEGDTTCPGVGGCSSVNANRAIQSLQNGASDAENPTRQYGLLTHFLSPVSVTIRDDTPTLSPTITTTTISNITTITTGTYTSVQTATPHKLLGVNEFITLSGVAGAGTCNGVARVRSIPDTTHFTAWLNTSDCVGASGGTAKTPTAFHAVGHNIYPYFAIASITSSIPTPSQTIVETSSPTHFIFGSQAQIGGVTSSGDSCDGINQNLPGTNLAWNVTSIIDATHFTIGYNSSGCTGQTGGAVVPYNQNYAANIVKATGEWTPWNSPLFAPGLVAPIDADNFTFFSDINTSAYTTPFNGSMQSEYVVPNTGLALAGYGFSHRFSICAGDCDSTSTGMEALTVHKVSQNYLTDLTLTTTAISPDANWYGVQTKDAVLMVPRGAVSHSTMSGFTTTHSGTARYLFGGMSAGTYTVTMNGVGVPGSPFTVTDGSNAIGFNSTSGTVSLNGSGILPPTIVLSPTSMSFSCVAGASAGSQQLSIGSTGNPLDNWGATKLQTYTTLSSTSGTSSANINVGVSCASLSAGVYSDTITVTSTTSGVTNSPQLMPITITVSSSGSPTLNVSPTSLSFTCVSGGSSAGQNVTISASLVSLDNWSATRGQTWDSLSPTSGSAPGVMSVFADCSALTAGPYSDTISVASTTSGITNSPQTISVSLVVSSGAASPRSLRGRYTLTGGATIR